MITLVTVVLDCVDEWTAILEDSIVTKLSLVKEVLMPKARTDPSYLKTWENKGIKFTVFGADHKVFPVGSPATACLDHAFNLHAGIDRANTDWVMCCDPDVFFYTDVSKFYLEMCQKYNLSIIGVSHPAAVTQAFTFFPNVLNMMLNKTHLPDNDFLADKFYLDYFMPELKNYHVQVPGKFLSTGPLPGTDQDFPNPTGHYETGSNLVLCAKEKNWKWMSFQTADAHTYDTRYYKTNFKFTDRMPKQKLLYHGTNSTSHGHSCLEGFKELWHQVKQEEDD